MKSEEPNYKTVSFRTADGYEFYYYEDIVRIEAIKNNTKVVLKNNEEIKVLTRLSEFIKKLPENMFLRCHRSHIINLTHIVRFNYKDGTITLSDGYPVPLSKQAIIEFNTLVNTI